MAVPSFLIEFEKELECSICCETMTSPKMVDPCHHTFCKYCLSQYVKSRKKTTVSFPCPQCRSNCLLPSKGIDGLKNDFRAENLISIVKANALDGRSIVATIQNLRCHNCLLQGITIDAMYTCDACDFDLCSDCKDYHLIKTSRLEDHFFYYTCSKHGRRMKHYCRKCDEVICVDCFTNNHTNECQIVLFKERLFGLLSEVAKQVKKASAESGSTEKQIKLLEARVTLAHNKGEAITSDIISRTNTLKSEISDIQQEIKRLEDLEAMKAAKIQDMEQLVTEIDKCCVDYSAKVDSYRRDFSKMMEKFDEGKILVKRLQTARCFDTKHHEEVNECKEMIGKIVSSLESQVESLQNNDLDCHLPHYEPERIMSSQEGLAESVQQENENVCRLPCYGPENTSTGPGMGNGYVFQPWNPAVDSLQNNYLTCHLPHYQPERIVSSQEGLAESVQQDNENVCELPRYGPENTSTGPGMGNGYVFQSWNPAEEYSYFLNK